MKIRLSIIQDFDVTNAGEAGDNEITDREVQFYTGNVDKLIDKLNDGYGMIMIEEIYDEETDSDGILTTRSRMLHFDDAYREDEEDSNPPDIGDPLDV